MIVRSSAKINLTLDILARRADGYHELASIVHTVGLWDTLHFEPTNSGTFEFDCSDVSLNSDENLCLKAARCWHKAARPKQWNGTRIVLEKHIPYGAGLGGGSGNAAATLVALNALYGTTLDSATLHDVAAKLGADVPLFLRGGCALMEGIGERLSPLPPLQGWLVLVQPEQTCSTPAIYGAWDAMNCRSGNSTNALQSTLTGNLPDLTAVAQRLHNDLRQAANRLGVDSDPIIEALRKAGALGAEMTGSGSAVFGIFADQHAAQQGFVAIQKFIADQRLSWRVWLAPLSAEGIQILDATSGNAGFEEHSIMMTQARGEE
jgi:4-diphosphocytidyl-2-C-methyl-D-erythritol kinase